jgi:hypothetical protein
MSNRSTDVEKKMSEDFDVDKFVESMDGTFDGDLSELDLPEDVLKKVAEIEAEMAHAEEAEEEDPEIDDDPAWLERQEMEDFEQADEYFGDFPI